MRIALRVAALACMAFSLPAGPHQAAAAARVKPEPSPGSTAALDEAEPSESRRTSGYYVVRRDVRRCSWPMCGGWFVTRVNTESTRCADGSAESECYVVEIDWSASGLDGSIGAGIVRGTLEQKVFENTWTLGVLAASDGWQPGVGGATPKGSFFRVEDLHTGCAQAPCFDKPAHKLNAKGVTRTVSDLSGALATQADAVLDTQPIIVAGKLSNTQNGGRALSVTQFWTRITSASPDLLSCNTDSDCTTTAYNKEVVGAQGCYCRLCPSTIMNTTAEAFYRTSWERSCDNVRLMCPMVMCTKPPEVMCANHQCVARSPSAGGN